MVSIPDWFWQLNERCRPDLNALARELHQLSREQLEGYLVYSDVAASVIREPWHGDLLDDIELSEDDIDDLSNWIVEQGQCLWQLAVADESHLADIYRAQQQLGKRRNGARAIGGCHIQEWHRHVDNPAFAGVQSPRGMAEAIYTQRFGVDYYEVQEFLLDHWGF